MTASTASASVFRCSAIPGGTTTVDARNRRPHITRRMVGLLSSIADAGSFVPTTALVSFIPLRSNPQMGALRKKAGGPDVTNGVGRTPASWESCYSRTEPIASPERPTASRFSRDAHPSHRRASPCRPGEARPQPDCRCGLNSAHHAKMIAFGPRSQSSARARFFHRPNGELLSRYRGRPHSEPSTGTNFDIAATDQIRPIAATTAIPIHARIYFPSASR